MSEALKIDEVVSKNMTWGDVFKLYEPDISEDKVDYILWNETCFPFDAQTTLNQIHTMFSNTTKNSIQQAHDKST